MRWRKENKIDTILNEDWESFERDYRFEIQGCDKGGRPVVTVPVGDWDVCNHEMCHGLQTSSVVTDIY